ncbi:hypothetical protein FB106_1363 [Synechococcus sp. Ace-Pa]|nr:hypothetical protein FB106_1363 [Synechococcus sp. Ace-Pa]
MSWSRALIHRKIDLPCFMTPRPNRNWRQAAGKEERQLDPEFQALLSEKEGDN